MSNHQHTLIIDGTSGISGDMTVAALLDLGASEEHLREQLDDGWRRARQAHGAGPRALGPD